VGCQCKKGEMGQGDPRLEKEALIYRFNERTFPMGGKQEGGPPKASKREMRRTA